MRTVSAPPVQASHESPIWRYAIDGQLTRFKTVAHILALRLQNWNVISNFTFQNNHLSVKESESNDLRIFVNYKEVTEFLTELYTDCTDGSKVIEVKIEPQYFELVENGFKLNELRLNDRHYKVGDLVIMHEIYDDGSDTGRAIAARINFTVTGKEADRWLKPNHINFGLSEIIVIYRLA